MMLTAVEWPAARRNTAIPHWLTGLAHWAVVSSIRSERIHILQTPDAEYQVKQVHVAFVAGDKRWFKRLLGCPSCIECVSVGVLKVRWSENNSGHLGTKKDGRTKLQETAMHKMHNLCQIIKPQIYHESSPIFTDLHRSSYDKSWISKPSCRRRFRWARPSPPDICCVLLLAQYINNTIQ